MSQISDMLIKEHKNILKVVDVLLKECDKIEGGNSIDKEFFRQVINFIRNYADKFHHAKEEDLMFKELCNNETNEKLHCNPVEQMLHEHDLGRNFVKEMEKGIEENDKDRIVDNGKGYAHLLQEHIFKEDNILYPMSEEAFSESVKKKMIKRFLEIEEERKDDNYSLDRTMG